MLDRKKIASLLLRQLKPRNDQFKHTHMFTLLSALHGLTDTNVFAARPNAAPLQQRLMVRILQEFAARHSVKLSGHEAEMILMDCGVSALGRVRSLLTPWENWSGIHADVLYNVCCAVPEAVEQESLAALLEYPVEVAQAYEREHPETRYPRVDVVRAARMVHQKLLVPELVRHPRELVVVVQDVRTNGEWHGEVVASPDFRHVRGSPFENIVSFISDGTQEGRTFLSTRNGTVIHSQVIRRSQYGELQRQRPGDIVRFMLSG